VEKQLVDAVNYVINKKTESKDSVISQVL